MRTVVHKTYPVITGDSKVEENTGKRFFKSRKGQKKSRNGLPDGYETHSEHSCGRQWGSHCAGLSVVLSGGVAFGHRRARPRASSPAPLGSLLGACEVWGLHPMPQRDGM